MLIQEEIESHSEYVQQCWHRFQFCAAKIHIFRYLVPFLRKNLSLLFEKSALSFFFGLEIELRDDSAAKVDSGRGGGFSYRNVSE